MMLRHLYLAYIATWIIHGVYLAFLAAKRARLKRELEEIKKQEVGTRSEK